MSNFPNGLYGESLKRIPQGYDKDHSATDLLKMKQFLVLTPIEFDDTFSPRLLDLLEEKAVALIGLLEYFHVAVNENS